MNDREELKIVCNKLGLNIDDIEFEIEGGRVVVLNLFNNMIEELPPTIFNNLPSLEYLGVYDNKIRELPVGIFDNLRFLRELSLGENKLSALSPKVLQDLSSLEVLYLNDNEITHLLPTTFNGLKSLKRLILNNNNISELPWGIFRNLHDLSDLNLSNNPISNPPFLNEWLSSSITKTGIYQLNDAIDRYWDQIQEKVASRIQKILKIIAQVRVDIPLSLIRLSELVDIKKENVENILMSILEKQQDLGEYLPLEQVFIKKSEVINEIFTKSTFTDSLLTCKACGDSQSILIRTCTNCGESLPHCNICKRGFAEKDQTTNCPECDNPFHRIHLIAQVQSSGSCPVCREPLTLAQVS